MSLPDRSIATDPRAYAGQVAGQSVTARVARLQNGLATRVADTAWSALHALGAHRWREGWETDLEKGWSRYRGSRCTICDDPWEGW
jgi:hypothetical protein